MKLPDIHRFIKEHDLLIGILIFGFFGMLGDIFSDLGNAKCAFRARIVGLIFLFILFVFDVFHKRTLKIPIMFTEEKNRDIYRNIFNSFIQNTKLSRTVKVLESKSQLNLNDLVIHINNNPRDSYDQQDWINAWKALIKEWDQIIDHKLTPEIISADIRCYYIVPQVILPLSFALGASVNFRRSLIIWHRQTEQYYQVADLTNPRDLFNEPSDNFPQPQIIPENADTLPKVNKLILHVVISERHPLNFEKHSDHTIAANCAIIYNFALDPKKNWLPYIQMIVQKAKPLISRYEEIEICLICPSAIAFALGMAFSRNSKITVCHWFADNQYRPVFPLSEIERQLPFS
jgi:hypothetical protein